MKLYILILLLLLLVLTACTKRVCSASKDCILYQTINKEFTSIPLTEKSTAENQGYTKYTKSDVSAECFKGICAISKDKQLLNNEGRILKFLPESHFL